MSEPETNTPEEVGAPEKAPETLTEKVEAFAAEIGEDAHETFEAFKAWVKKELGEKKPEIAESDLNTPQNTAETVKTVE